MQHLPEPIAILSYPEPDPARFLLPRPAVFTASDWTDLYLELHQQPAFSTAEHQHAWHAIALSIPDPSNSPAQGSRWLDGKRHTERRQPGDLAIIPAGISHRCSWDRDAQFMVLAIAPETFTQVGQDWVNPDQIELMPQWMDRADPFIHTIASTLKAEATSAGMASPLLIDSLKSALVIHLLRYYCTTRPKLSSYSGGLSDTTLKRVTDYIQAHLHLDLKLVDLAAIAQMSPYYFARLFKQRLGITPHQYILEQRVKQAQYLLRHSSLNIAEIAVRVGFCDQSHLTRCFKRLMGITPTQFLQRC